MRKTNRIISLLVLICFLFNTALSDLAFSQSLNYRPNTDNLAPAYQTDDLGGIEHKDIGRIMLALEAQLTSLGENIKTFKELKLRENTIFQPADIQFFFNERKEIGQGRFRVMCRTRDKYGLRTYYALFSIQKDRDGGFPIKIYTEAEYKKLDEFTGVLPERKPKDAKAIERYVEQNEKIIDKFIQARIAEGNFTEIEGWAKALGWDEKYPDRKRPKAYWPEKYKEIIIKLINPFLQKVGISLGEALSNKNIVFIRVSKYIRFPEVNEDGRAVIVKSHTSENAVYIFLGEEEFDNLKFTSVQRSIRETAKGIGEGDSDLSRGQDSIDRAIESGYLEVEGTLKDSVISDLIHVIGVIYNLPYAYDDGEIKNDLDRAYSNYLHHNHSRAQILNEFPALRNLKDKRADLNTNLLYRDYMRGEDKPLKGIDLKDMARIELALKENFTDFTKLLPSPLRTLRIEELRKELGGRGVWEKTIFNPVAIVFHFDDMGEMYTPDGNRYWMVECDIEDGGNSRTYYAIVTPKEAGDKFQIEMPLVLAEDDYLIFSDSPALLLNLVKQGMKPELRKAIDRYVEHEKNIDAWIAWKMGNKDEYFAMRPADIVSGSIYKEGIQIERVLSTLGIKNTNLILQSMEKRNLVFIHANEGELPEIHIPDLEGRLQRIKVSSHTSNNAIYIMLNDEEWNDFQSVIDTDQKPHIADARSFLNKAVECLVYELGALCGLPGWAEKKDGIYVAYNNLAKLSELIFRALDQEETLSDEAKELREKLKDIKPVDLDKNVHFLTRDYAGTGFFKDVGDMLTGIKEAKKEEPAQNIESILKDKLLRLKLVTVNNMVLIPNEGLKAKYLKLEQRQKKLIRAIYNLISNSAVETPHIDVVSNIDQNKNPGLIFDYFELSKAGNINNYIILFVKDIDRTKQFIAAGEDGTVEDRFILKSELEAGAISGNIRTLELKNAKLLKRLTGYISQVDALMEEKSKLMHETTLLLLQGRHENVLEVVENQVANAGGIGIFPELRRYETALRTLEFLRPDLAEKLKGMKGLVGKSLKEIGDAIEAFKIPETDEEILYRAFFPLPAGRAETSDELKTIKTKLGYSIVIFKDRNITEYSILDSKNQLIRTFAFPANTKFKLSPDDRRILFYRDDDIHPYLGKRLPYSNPAIYDITNPVTPVIDLRDALHKFYDFNYKFSPDGRYIALAFYYQSQKDYVEYYDINVYDLHNPRKPILSKLATMEAEKQAGLRLNIEFTPDSSSVKITSVGITQTYPLGREKIKPQDRAIRTITLRNPRTGEQIKVAPVIKERRKDAAIDWFYRQFDSYDLDRLVEIYEHPTLFKLAKERHAEIVVSGGKSLYGVYLKLFESLESMLINMGIRPAYDRIGRIKIDAIGGIETLKTALDKRITADKSIDGLVGIDRIDVMPDSDYKKFSEWAVSEKGLGAAIGIDIGGTQLTAGVVDSKGNILAKIEILTNIPASIKDKSNPPGSIQELDTREKITCKDRVIRDIAKLVIEVAKKAGISQDAITSVGAGSPGKIRTDGYVELAYNVPFQGINLREEIAKAIEEATGKKIEVYLNNDMVTPLSLEAAQDYTAGYNKFTSCTDSSGVNGARYYRDMKDGKNLEFGTWGFLDENGEKHSLEYFTSGPNMKRIAIAKINKLGEEGKASLIYKLVNGDLDKLDGSKEIGVAANKGDKLALEILDEVGYYYGKAIVRVCQKYVEEGDALEEELFIIGGGVTKIGEPLLNAYRTGIERASKEVDAKLPKIKVILSKFPSDRGIIGAAEMARKLHEKSKASPKAESILPAKDKGGVVLHGPDGIKADRVNKYSLPSNKKILVIERELGQHIPFAGNTIEALMDKRLNNKVEVLTLSERVDLAKELKSRMPELVLAPINNPSIEKALKVYGSLSGLDVLYYDPLARETDLNLFVPFEEPGDLEKTLRALELHKTQVRRTDYINVTHWLSLWAGKLAKYLGWPVSDEALPSANAFIVATINAEGELEYHKDKKFQIVGEREGPKDGFEPIRIGPWTRAIIISPHPDDNIITVAGLTIKLLRAGAKVINTVTYLCKWGVILTEEEIKKIQKEENLTEEEAQARRGELRRNEILEADELLAKGLPGKMEVNIWEDLEFLAQRPDGTFKENIEKPEVKAMFEKAVDRAIAYLRELDISNPYKEIFVAPYYQDSHPTHRAANAVFVEAIKRFSREKDLKGCRVLFYLAAWAGGFDTYFHSTWNAGDSYIDASTNLKTRVEIAKLFKQGLANLTGELTEGFGSKSPGFDEMSGLFAERFKREYYPPQTFGGGAEEPNWLQRFHLYVSIKLIHGALSYSERVGKTHYEKVKEQSGHEGWANNYSKDWANHYLEVNFPEDPQQKPEELIKDLNDKARKAQEESNIDAEVKARGMLLKLNHKDEAQVARLNKLIELVEGRLKELDEEPSKRPEDVGLVGAVVDPSIKNYISANLKNLLKLIPESFDRGQVLNILAIWNQNRMTEEATRIARSQLVALGIDETKIKELFNPFKIGGTLSGEGRIKGTDIFVPDSGGLIDLINPPEDKGTVLKVGTKRPDFAKSVKDAKKVIELLLIKKESFTLKEYINAYEGVRKRYPALELVKLIDAYHRSILDALEAQGILIINRNRNGIPSRYQLANRAQKTNKERLGHLLRGHLKEDEIIDMHVALILSEHKRKEDKEWLESYLRDHLLFGDKEISFRSAMLFAGYKRKGNINKLINLLDVSTLSTSDRIKGHSALLLIGYKRERQIKILNELLGIPGLPLSDRIDIHTAFLLARYKIKTQIEGLNNILESLDAVEESSKSHKISIYTAFLLAGYEPEVQIDRLNGFLRDYIVDRSDEIKARSALLRYGNNEVYETINIESDDWPEKRRSEYYNVLSDLSVQNRIVNALIGMIIEYSKTKNGLLEEDKFVRFDPDSNICWLGDSSNNQTFLDVFDKLLKIGSGGDPITERASDSIEREFVEGLLVKADLLGKKLFMPLGRDDFKELLDIIKAQLSGYQLIESFGVETGMIYAMAYYSKNKDAVLRRAGFERELHKRIIDKIFMGDVNAYRLWREGEEVVLDKASGQVKYIDIWHKDNNNYKISLEIIEIDGRYRLLTDYDEFGREARKIAEWCYPLPTMGGLPAADEGGVIGKGQPLLELKGGRLPPQAQVDLKEFKDIVDKVKNAITIALGRYDAVKNESGKKGEQTSQNLKIILRSLEALDEGVSMSERLHLFNADVRGADDYLVGFPYIKKVLLLTTVALGLSVDFINRLYSRYSIDKKTADLRLAQYIFKVGTTKGEASSITASVFRSDEVAGFEKDLQRFINQKANTVSVNISPKPLAAVAWGNYLLTQTKEFDDRVNSTVFELRSGKPLLKNLDIKEAGEVQRSPKYLAFFDSADKLRVYDLEAGKAIVEGLSKEGISSFKLASKYLALRIQNRLTVYDLGEEKPVFENLDVRGDDYAITSSHLAVCNTASKVTLYEIGTKDPVLKELDAMEEAGGGGVNLQLVSKYFAFRISDNKYALYDIQSAKVKDKLSSLKEHGFWLTSTTPTRFVVRDSGFQVTIYDPETERSLNIYDKQKLDAQRGQWAFSKYVICRDNNGDLSVYDIQDLKWLFRILDKGRDFHCLEGLKYIGFTDYTKDGKPLSFFDFYGKAVKGLDEVKIENKFKLNLTSFRSESGQILCLPDLGDAYRDVKIVFTEGGSIVTVTGPEIYYGEEAVEMLQVALNKGMVFEVGGIGKEVSREAVEEIKKKISTLTIDWANNIATIPMIIAGGADFVALRPDDARVVAAIETLKKEGNRVLLWDTNGLEHIGKTLTPDEALDALKTGEIFATEYSSDKTAGIVNNVMFRTTEIAIPHASEALANSQAKDERREEITAMDKMALQVGTEIATKIDGLYTLMLPFQFYRGEDDKVDEDAYGSRFRRQQIGGKTLDEFVANILKNASGKEAKCAALISKDMIETDNQEHKNLLKKLTDANIRFIIADIKDAGLSDNKEGRFLFRRDAYATMILTRYIEKGMEGTLTYRLLSFYLRSHYNGFTEKITVDDYIEAIKKGDAAELIKGWLVYKPCDPYDAIQEYHNISRTLIFA